MLTKRVTCFSFLIVFIINYSRAQEGTDCSTPLKESGLCIGIRACDPLLNLLRKFGSTPQVTSYLRQSACGWKNENALVCCPQPKLKSEITPRPEVGHRKIETPPPPPQYFDAVLPRPPDCGHNNVSKSRIVNGIPALLGEFPWIVALGYRNPNNPDQPKWLCGGTLITNRHVVTAAHCVNNRPDLYVARLGELDLYSDDDGAQPTTIPLSKAKIHEQYSAVSYTNDIAILTLAQPNTNPTVTPICLPIDEPLKSNNFVGYQLFVAGWGAVYFDGPASPDLQTTLLPVVSNEQCSRAFVNFKTTTIDQRVLCAGYLQGGRDACQGDSGGPLMYGKPEHKDTRFYLIGVVSYGFRCAEEGFPGVYSRITSFYEWIANNLD